LLIGSPLPESSREEATLAAPLPGSEVAERARRSEVNRDVVGEVALQSVLDRAEAADDPEE
jgi:hypothetical protein